MIVENSCLIAANITCCAFKWSPAKSLSPKSLKKLSYWLAGKHLFLIIPNTSRIAMRQLPTTLRRLTQRLPDAVVDSKDTRVRPVKAFRNHRIMTLERSPQRVDLQLIAELDLQLIAEHFQWLQLERSTERKPICYTLTARISGRHWQLDATWHPRLCSAPQSHVKLH